ncbi:membrane dipeptidase GliJ [Byssothecium circinans]|uniref:Dipeptidase n=1 Tax=Byssothecium circinans TaxID=147558 RepID=A0A6A5TD62_9PLEO|nr:membrane dipeptidase GliJ [Byssothecium circinans]
MEKPYAQIIVNWNQQRRTLIGNSLSRMMILRTFSLSCVALALYLLSLPRISHIWHSDRGSVYSEAPLIDGHNDFPIWIRAFYHNHLYQDNFTQPTELYGQVDFPRLRKGKLRGQFWSVYVECPKVYGNYSAAAYREIVHDTLQQIDLVQRLVKAYPEYLRHAYSAADIWKNFRGGPRISSLMGIEGLHQIGNSASILRMYRSLGVRYATLTHTCHNIYADSEEPHNPLHGGLSNAGKALVREMNRLGMIVDLSHTSFDTQRDALAASIAPVIFSHSNAYTLRNHTRNVPDEILQKLKRNDGVIMVTFYPSFLENDDVDASLNSVVSHIMYIGETIGYRHVGIGSDFDGMEKGPEALEDVSKYPDLIVELQKRQVKRVDILAVMGLNVLRVLEDVERISASMDDILPLEDDVKPFFNP